MRRFNIAMLVLILLIGVPFYWLMLDNRPGNAAPKPIHIAQLRQLADSLPGARPAALQGEAAAFRSLPRNLFAAGSGMAFDPITVLAYRLVNSDGTSVMIDSGITPHDAAAMKMSHFNAKGQARINRALGEASLVLFTHEHPDHMGAALQLPQGLPAAARLPPGQLPPSPVAAQLPWPRIAPPPTQLGNGAPFAVAPGIVVIPAPGSHTPGSQMIFARLADGREVLFAGDIATLRYSWQQLRARSNLVGRYMAPENRDEVYAWLQTIRQLKREAPDLAVIPGHDISTLYPAGDRPAIAQSPLRFELQHKAIVE